jgi:hypothetical protein
MSSIHAHNAKEIDALRRRYRRVQFIFFTSVALMPLGVICPCTLALIINQVRPGSGQFVAPGALLLPLIGLVGTLLMLSDRSRYRRALALADLAKEQELRYTYEPPRSEFKFLLDLPFMNLPRIKGSGVGANRLEGTFKKRPLTALDYAFNYRVGNDRETTQQTVAVFTAGFEQFPSFLVIPQGWAEKFEEFILGATDGDRIKRNFTVAGMQRDAILDLLTPAVIEFFLEDHNLVLEMAEGMMMVYRRDAHLTAPEYQDFLLQAVRLAKELEKARA